MKMATKMNMLLPLGLIMSLVSMAIATPGTSTFNTIFVPSFCYGFEDQGNMVAAASDEIFNGGAACGTFYTVTCTGATNQGVPQPCTGNSVTVKITDRCPPPGCQATLDLAQDAFSIIADTDAGKITIDYTQV